VDIQDLGAIGEFVSSIVIVVTLVILVFEVRGTKRAMLGSNAQERHRGRDLILGMLAESPDLADILTRAQQFLGNTPYEAADDEFGIERGELARLHFLFMRQMAHMKDAWESELPDDDRRYVDISIANSFADPAFAKWYDIMRPTSRSGDREERWYAHMDRLRTDRT